MRGGFGSSDSMLSGRLAPPRPSRDGQLKERGNETNPTESRSDLQCPGGLGIGRRIATDLVADFQLMQFGRLGSQTGIEIAETLAIGHLDKRYAEKLVEITKAEDVEVALMLRLEPTKGVLRGDLRKDELANGRRHLLMMTRKPVRLTGRRSNR